MNPMGFLGKARWHLQADSWEGISFPKERGKKGKTQIGIPEDSRNSRGFQHFQGSSAFPQESRECHPFQGYPNPKGNWTRDNSSQTRGQERGKRDGKSRIFPSPGGFGASAFQGMAGMSPGAASPSGKAGIRLGGGFHHSFLRGFSPLPNPPAPKIRRNLWGCRG